MDRIQKTPTTGSRNAGDINSENKGSHIYLNGQIRLLNLLRQGGRYSAADLSSILHLCDPRSHIRALRQKNINIRDVWVQAGAVRYKLYFLNGADDGSRR